ncbi:MAG TPA: hypothetical protein VIM80_05805 [Brevefilum sp.]
MTNNLQDQNDSSPSGFVRAISEPLSSRGWPRWLVYLIGLIGGAYILNPTLGIFELIPDALPVVGNLDEGAAMMMVLAGIVEAIEGRKLKRAQKQVKKERQ